MTYQVIKHFKVSELVFSFMIENNDNLIIIEMIHYSVKILYIDSNKRDIEVF